GNIGASLGGSTQMAEKGTSVLSSLLGGGALGLLISTVGKFVGMSEGSTRLLMGFLTPVIMGVLGREQGATYPGAGGLARMLTDQKDGIAAAMPSGLGKLLEASGLHDRIDTAGAAESRSDRPRAGSAQSSMPVPLRASTDREGSLQSANWLYWVVPLLVI